MKLWFIFIFTLVGLLLIALYNFLAINIFDSKFYTLVAIVPAFVITGLILYELIIEPKRSQDRVLENLIKETLHEINLPINTIDANIKMLSKRLSDSKDLKKLSRIEGSLDRLKRLYEQLSYNIKKELIPIVLEELDLKEIVKDRVSHFREFNRNEFILELNSLKIKVDKIGLEQVIDNIIENSMKYSVKDSEIFIKIYETTLEIEDFGIGIEQDELSLIYQRYYRESQEGRGDGIGLSIVKSYCDRYGITLKIESKKGVGTKVILDFNRLVL